ncbi:hypothetical protein I0D00_01000 [Pseudomonas lalucatii]|uniref:Uncharacterized protein n=1 Tax=Pseudomonas lalucatii TaxID=1424203 RepID=A0ABS5PWS9_9PSED|nr:hypothetical protein [Pseudomonas lalucatii]MBS7660528.1 hypothetical protein [Pseudomonas lalucatii]
MNIPSETEYRDSMQAAAMAFLQRHQGEYLGNEQLLFTRAVSHLQHALDVPLYMAENLVGLAYGELRSQGLRLQLDVASSSSHTAMITDPGSGMTFAVPVALIVQHLIESPARRRLRAVS